MDPYSALFSSATGLASDAMATPSQTATSGTTNDTSSVFSNAFVVGDGNEVTPATSTSTDTNSLMSGLMPIVLIGVAGLVAVALIKK